MDRRRLAGMRGNAALPSNHNEGRSERSGLLPWAQLLATNVWASRLDTPADKLAAHHAAIEQAFQWMDDWRAKRTKFVRKNEKAISSAISYLRNGAQHHEVRDLLISPVARNAAGCLRMCLHLASFNYEDSQVPGIAACQVFDLAAVRTLYPIDLGNLTRYAPDSIYFEDERIDNFNAMLSRGSRDLALDVDLGRLNREAERIWLEFEIAHPMELSSALSEQKGGERNAKLYFQSLNDFHGSSSNKRLHSCIWWPLRSATLIRRVRQL